MVARLLLALFQSVNSPCAYPLIAQAFNRDSRSTANGLYGVGTYVGRAVSSLTIGASLRIGWRQTTMVSSAFGLAAAVLLACTPTVGEDGDAGGSGGGCASLSCLKEGARHCSSSSRSESQNVFLGDEEKQSLLLSSSNKTSTGLEEKVSAGAVPTRPSISSSSSFNKTPGKGSSSTSTPSLFPASPQTKGDEFSPPPPPSITSSSLPFASFTQISPSSPGVLAVARIVATSPPLLLLFAATSFRMCGENESKKGR